MSVWITASSIISPLGKTSAENYLNVRQKISGVRQHAETLLSDRAVTAGILLDYAATATTSRFELICRDAVEAALRNISFDRDRTLFILSTTKGNIARLGSGTPDELSLDGSARRISKHFGFKNSLVVSNACISGVLAIIVAKRYIESGKFDHAVVLGADELSRFIVAGFESLHALSDKGCRPFDNSRDGINLGEAAAVVVLSSQHESGTRIKITGGGLSNDANHISGPSRTGDELAMAIAQAFKESAHSASDVDFISAHGTATIFNDEMESKAFAQAGLGATPLNSLKGYFGHTLGAAGVLETVMSMEALIHNEIPATLGFETMGVSMPVNVTRDLVQTPTNICLKTASGFGGCNAALVFEK